MTNSTAPTTRRISPSHVHLFMSCYPSITPSQSYDCGSDFFPSSNSRFRSAIWVCWLATVFSNSILNFSSPRNRNTEIKKRIPNTMAPSAPPFIPSNIVILPCYRGAYAPLFSPNSCILTPFSLPFNHPFALDFSVDAFHQTTQHATGTDFVKGVKTIGKQFAN